MAYTKTTWSDGQNKYHIKDQSDNIIYSDTKIVYSGTGGTPVSSTNLNHIEQGIADAHNGLVVAGVVLYHTANSAPTGFLKCNGAAVSRTTYSTLFTAIGTTFGVGDGSTTFNLPDLRGEFIRAWDDSRGIDSGRTFASWQADDNKAHTHTYNTPTVVSGGNISNGANQPFTNSQSTGSSGGTEARPRNIALLAVIKY